MVRADYIIIGAGLTGATVARVLADAGRDVVVLERRPEVGGNCADALYPGTNIRYGLYGPHYFRTNSPRIWEWAQRFGTFYPWSASVQTSIGGKCYRWPLLSTEQHLRSTAIGQYNRKMWGTEDPPGEIKSRVECRQDDKDLRLKTDKYQGLPREGYTAWIAEMLRGITVLKGFNFFHHLESVQAQIKLIYTGPIDALFGCCYGRLRYRGQMRQTKLSDHREPVQTTVQVNYPEPHVRFIRAIEWNHMMEIPRWEHGSLVTYETPFTPLTDDHFEYPYNDDKNKDLYQKYCRFAALDSGLVLAGRLGTYRYLDMDQAIGHGLSIAERLLAER